MKKFWDRFWFNGLVIAIGFFVLYVTISFLIYDRNHRLATTEARDYCYDRVAHVREMVKIYGIEYAPEYVAMVPMLDRIAKDKFLSVSECNEVDKELDLIHADDERKARIKKLL